MQSRLYVSGANTFQMLADFLMIPGLLWLQVCPPGVAPVHQAFGGEAGGQGQDCPPAPRLGRSVGVSAVLVEGGMLLGIFVGAMALGLVLIVATVLASKGKVCSVAHPD